MVVGVAAAGPSWVAAAEQVPNAAAPGLELGFGYGSERPACRTPWPCGPPPWRLPAAVAPRCSYSKCRQGDGGPPLCRQPSRHSSVFSAARSSFSKLMSARLARLNQLPRNLRKSMGLEAVLKIASGHLDETGAVK